DGPLGGDGCVGSRGGPAELRCGVVFCRAAPPTCVSPTGAATVSYCGARCAGIESVEVTSDTGGWVSRCRWLTPRDAPTGSTELVAASAASSAAPSATAYLG